MIKSKYNPENGIVSLWNCLNTQQRYDYTLLDLDTNLCFTKGWIDFPPKRLWGTSSMGRYKTIY